MNHKKILITGSQGFIGRHLSVLIQRRYPYAEVIGVDYVDAKGKVNIPITRVDLLDQDKIADTIRRIKPDYIFHLAGKIYTSSFGELYESNVRTTKNLMECLITAESSCRIIIPGSAAEYGDVRFAALPVGEDYPPHPVSPYGVSKVWQTTVAQYYARLGADLVIGRMFNLIGKGVPEGLSLGSFVNQLKQIKKRSSERILKCGNLKAKRDFVDVEDACLGLMAIAEKGKRDEVYNICRGESHSIDSLLQEMIRMLNMTVHIEIDKERFKRQDIDEIFGCNEKIFKDTGWRPKIEIKDSCRKMLADL